MKRVLGILAALAVCLLIFGSGQARAQSPVLVLEGPAQDAQLRGHIDALLETGDRLSPQNFSAGETPAMRPVTSAWPDFGYTSDRIWLRLRLRNTTENQNWRLHARDNFFQEYSVFILRANGEVETVFDTDRTSPFDARPIAFPQLVAPVTLAQGEEATVLIRYRSEGSSHLALSIETLESFSALANVRTAKAYLFYGMMALLITVAMLSLVLFRARVFAAYAAYSVSSLLYIMHGDGVAFQMLWPNWPAFNSMASVVTGSGVIISGAVYARVFLETPRLHPRMDIVLRTIIAMTLLLTASLWFTYPQLLKQLLIVFSMVAIITFAISGIVAARTRFREVRFYVVAWLGVVGSAVILNTRHIVGIEISQEVQYDSMRAALVFDALMIGLAIADRFNTLRRSRRAALDASLVQAHKNTALANRLTQLGARYERAQALAQGRGEILENTVHDLRQPMQGLRLALRGLDTGTGGGHRARADNVRRFEASLAYMERLIEDRIAGADTIEQHGEPPAAEMGIHAVLRSVQTMFAPEAEAKGLEVRLALAAPDTVVSTFALMRLVSNLVANAVKFTDTGAVLIALRRDGTGLRVEVHDTGPGLTQTQFSQARKRHVRLEQKGAAHEGSGLGLAISDHIASTEGWTMRLARGRRQGAGIVLHIPATALQI
ncbi:sensor histidine kinase [uncultured Sulfitobacter sp.]|uniref:sensor histidine kinase n=1 Tax=uncultured Sulfitobacter sp. TaxID=191468 RepID=UPI00262ABCFC|nr:sensor histidine kinase [uncultured Sulfitobacter sp.]